ncbi:MAG: HAD family phosphatase [Candidatus Melainabacteria bacterium]|nr:HAD family phosphatase [Candidatus Melainabacteria bacterium]
MHFDLRALIFDMDGVLIDSEPMHLEAFKRFFKTLNIEYTAEQNALYLGRKDSEISELLIEKYGLNMTAPELVEKKEEIFRQLILAESSARPGVMQTLKEAVELGINRAVASSATLPTIKLIVNTLKLNQYFHSLSSGDEVKNGKPAPDVFLLAAERMQIAPEHCLVIEDTEAGVQAARAAGMKVVAIPCDATKHQTHALADMRLDSLSELKLKDWVQH